MKKRVHLFVNGRVQGVFFRSRTLAMARKIGATGWIRNLKDGRVEAVFEGDEKAIEEMISFCKTGSPEALVKDVEIKWEIYTGEYKTFTII